MLLRLVVFVCRCRSRQLNAIRRGIAGTFLFIVLSYPWVIPWGKVLGG